MRSRLEASVAAWLDEFLAGSWEYEPMAYADRSGQYLPDFVLHIAGAPTVYIEVRATEERARQALTQMPVIWASDPDAILSVIVPPIGIRITATQRMPWTTFEWDWT